MLKNNKKIVVIGLLMCFLQVNAQEMSLQKVLETIQENNPLLKMQDAEIKSMDTLAFGAKTWMNPQVNTGLFMAPYNPSMWSSSAMNNGMGNYMVGVTQMIPNAKKQEANYAYLKGVSSIEKKRKSFNNNRLNAMAKMNYYQWIVLEKKKKILQENQQLLSYMMKSIEVRYEYNTTKLSNYFKAESHYENIELQLLQLENEVELKRIALNTLMSRDKSQEFTIDTNFVIQSFDEAINDTTLLTQNRSDIKAIESTIQLNELKINAEKAKNLPEFGVQYNHMFTFGSNPQMFSLMAMASIPMPWSTKMNEAKIISTKFKNESLNWQKSNLLNNIRGQLETLNADLKTKTKQLAITEDKILPALKKNYELSLLAWQNNTGNLFEVLDAWEAYNMTQIEALDKLEKILMLQVAIEEQLEL